MTDEQDVSIALIRQELEQLKDELAEVKADAKASRDLWLQSKAGLRLLFVLGGLVTGIGGLWYYATNTPPFSRGGH